MHRKYKENLFKILRSGYCDAIISQGDKLSEFNTDSLSKLGMFYNQSWLQAVKVERVFPMFILSDFRMGQYRDDDHWEDALHFDYSL